MPTPQVFIYRMADEFSDKRLFGASDDYGIHL